MKYKVDLEVFEGPMDLLLHLINSAQVDIYDIPINLITEQFIEYIKKMEELNLEVASEFLLMASTLIEIKSKLLLPKEESKDEDEGIDPREELVARLLEYKRYKKVSKELKQLGKKESKVYYKPMEEFQEEKPKLELDNLDMESLLKAINNIIKTQNKKEEEILTVDEIQREEYSIEECMKEIENILYEEKIILFTSLLNQNTRAEVVAYFLAILELTKIRRIKIVQEKLEDIKLTRREWI